MRTNDHNHPDLARFAERQAIRRLEDYARRLIAERQARATERTARVETTWVARKEPPPGDRRDAR